MIKTHIGMLLLGLISASVCGQTVGLVLSGGGAKGLAHIGVIEALEEQRIPIDYVGGTSMGAIIGGLYAMGYSTEEMKEVVRSDEFHYWMTGKLEEEYNYFFKREHPGPDLVSIGLDIRDTIPRTFLPLSLIPNYLMDFAFMEIFSRASAAARYNFDSLFVPFLCNSADISNNVEIVFRDGDLAQAVRASMTVPLYFRPIVMDGKIMYDGGIYNNFPVNHVREQFEPDVLIGSKAAEDNTPPDEFDILGQIENIVMKPAEYKIVPEEGLLLDMDFDKVSLLAFEKLDQFVDQGYRKTMERMDEISEMVERRALDSAGMAERRSEYREQWPEFRFGDLDIYGLNTEQKSYVEQSFQRAKDTIGIDELRKEYLKLASDRSLLYLYPHAVYNEEDSIFTLRLRVIPQSPMEARFGLHFSTTGMAQTYLGFSYRNISEVSSHLKGSIQFGRFYNGANVGFRFDYPSRTPLYFQAEFNYNGFNYNTSSTNFLFQDLAPSFITEDEINVRLDAGMPYSTNGVLNAGVGIGRNREVYYMTRNFTSSDTSEVSSVNKLSLYVAGERNTLNEKQFPTEGRKNRYVLRMGYGGEFYTPGSTSETGNDERSSYFSLTALYENTGYVLMKEPFRLGYLFKIHADFRPLMLNYFSTLIEAPVFQPNMVTRGMFMESYRARQFIAAGVMPVYRYSSQVHAKLEAYAFFPVQEILRGSDNRAYLGTYFNRMKTLFNASVNFVTVAGPVTLQAGYITEEERPWIFQISFGYLLFNKRIVEQ